MVGLGLTHPEAGTASKQQHGQRSGNSDDAHSNLLHWTNTPFALLVSSRFR